MFTGICIVGFTTCVGGLVYTLYTGIKEQKDWSQIERQLDAMQFKEAYSAPEFDSNGLIINW